MQEMHGKDKKNWKKIVEEHKKTRTSNASVNNKNQQLMRGKRPAKQVFSLER